MDNHSLHRIAAAVMVLGVLAACKKTAPPPAQAPIEVASVDLGRQIGPDRRVVQSMTTFGLNDTIYASVATTGTAASAVLTAKWTYQTGQTVDSTTMTIAPTGPAQTEFHIMKASPWPAGGYTLTIWLNGQSVGQKAFEVK
ncbi:MAG TPA: hypothetical protein VKP10_09415 [Gemmatimonadales bacterium]|nr:hypothetical protein [Gemmatimonadales bacterium]